MKLTVFQAGKGDCLLLTSSDGKKMLVDGGVAAAYTANVAPKLEQLKQLEVVCVSHIDDDHIGGVLQMLDDEAAWRVYMYQQDAGNTSFPRPDAKRPPEIGKLWHNGFSDLIGQNTGDIAEMLSHSVRVLSGAESAELQQIGAALQNLTEGVKQAIQLSRRIGDKQLGIPLNPEFGNKLMLLDENGTTPPLKLGNISLLLVGPTVKELDALRKEWQDWLRKNKTALTGLRRAARDDEDLLGNRAGGEAWRGAELTGLMANALAQADALGTGKVTPPNLASMALLAEENGKTILLAGDARGKEMLNGLRSQGQLDAAGRLHLDVLKVPHHGSEKNMDEAFCEAVTADHYLFCANGFSENPDPRILQAIVDARLGDPNDRRKFKFWFNNNANTTSDKYKAHMTAVENKVTELAADSQGRLTYFFLSNGDSFDLPF